MRSVVLAFLICLFVLPSEAKKKQTFISAEIQGFERDMVYFDFMEKDGINQEIPYMENQLMEFSVELDDITMMKINAWVDVCLQPGDSIHAKIIYEGKNYTSVEFTGTPGAVAVSTALHKMRMSQREDRYKENIPAALVTLVDAKKHYAGTLKEWKEVVSILDGVKDQISPKMYNYVLSDQEGVLITNLITYPYASSSFHKKKIEECISDGYWDALNDYKLRDDDGSLRSEAYMVFLLTYKDYMKCKETGNVIEHSPNKDIEKEYADLAAFYDGTLRDASLFVLLYNSIAANGDFKVIEKLKKDYLKNYNQNKEYKKILSQVMK